MLQRSRTRVSAESTGKQEQVFPTNPLQRSRTRVSAESCCQPPVSPLFSLLQRSRTRVSAESGFAGEVAATVHTRFNGAALV